MIEEDKKKNRAPPPELTSEKEKAMLEQISLVEKQLATEKEKKKKLETKVTVKNGEIQKILTDINDAKDTVEMPQNVLKIKRIL